LDYIQRVAEVDVQALLDGVAAELGAAVALDDVELRVVAYTADGDVTDEIRRYGIMHRHPSVEARAWFEQWGIRETAGPVRTPADPTRGILDRWCIPVRFRGLHLGYVWVLEGDRISEEKLKPAVDAADQMGALLYRRRLSIQADTDLLRLLLTPNPENELVAAEARASFHARNGAVAVVIAGTSSVDEPTPAALSDLALAVQRAAEQAPSETLAGVISGCGVLLAPLPIREDLASARRLAENLCRLAGYFNRESQFLATIGSPTELERASHSYAEARRALRIVRAMPELGPIVAWDDLGVFRALALLPTGDLEANVLDPRVRRLLDNTELAATAEAFLDLAGNVQETAARLYVHRTTLYQRLDRIAALYELDLRRSGDHRLLTHLGLKMARVAPRNLNDSSPDVV
jgi:hypothetical protein